MSSDDALLAWRLQQLQELVDKELISGEEFDERRVRILSELRESAQRGVEGFLDPGLPTHEAEGAVRIVSLSDHVAAQIEGVHAAAAAQQARQQAVYDADYQRALRAAAERRERIESMRNAAARAWPRRPLRAAWLRLRLLFANGARAPRLREAPLLYTPGQRDELRRLEDSRGGELILPRLLESVLSDAWTLVQGYRNSKGEADWVLVGPGGVYAIEIKYVNGDITIDNDGRWWRDKYDNYGNLVDVSPVEDRGGRSPAQQVAAVAAEFERFVSRSVPVRVRTAVIFTHDKSRLGSFATDPGVDLVATAATLDPRALTEPAGDALGADDVAQLVALVERDHQHFAEREGRRTQDTTGVAGARVSGPSEAADRTPSPNAAAGSLWPYYEAPPEPQPRPPRDAVGGVSPRRNPLNPGNFPDWLRLILVAFSGIFVLTVPLMFSRRARFGILPYGGVIAAVYLVIVSLNGVLATDPETGLTPAPTTELVSPTQAPGSAVTSTPAAALTAPPTATMSAATPVPIVPNSEAVDPPEEALISFTGGRGVSHRDDCLDSARTGREGILEGVQVLRVARGLGRCEGWSFVRSPRVESWVLDSYLR